MAMFLKQSTAADVAIGPFLDATDGVTAEAALTITQPDVRLSKNGAAFAQKSAAQTLSHMENGYYSCNLSTTDTGTLGLLKLHVAESGAVPVWHDFIVLAANVYDSLVGGGDTLDVQVTGIGAGAITAAAIATDAIDNDALAANAVTEIQSGLATVAGVLTTAMTEAYAADGAAPTLAQAIFLIMQRLTEFSITGTTLTVKKLDGSTTAATITHNDADAPTSATRTA
jgi:hypothetical protein